PAVTPAANRTTQSALIPSLPTAYLAPAASRWLATPPSCAVNKLVAACACLVHDAAVPRSDYRSKHRETQFRFNGSCRRQSRLQLHSRTVGCQKDADGESGVGVFHGNAENRERTYHCFPSSRGVFW